MAVCWRVSADFAAFRFFRHPQLRTFESVTGRMKVFPHVCPVLGSTWRHLNRLRMAGRLPYSPRNGLPNGSGLKSCFCRALRLSLVITSPLMVLKCTFSITQYSVLRKSVNTNLLTLRPFGTLSAYQTQKTSVFSTIWLRKLSANFRSVSDAGGRSDIFWPRSGKFYLNARDAMRRQTSFSGMM